jgi:hypothetical protein
MTQPLSLVGSSSRQTGTLPNTLRVMSPDPNWYSTDRDGETVYLWSDGAGGDAVVEQEGDRWHLSFSVSDGPWVQRDLGQFHSPDQAITQADEVIELGYSTQEYLGERESARERIQGALRDRNEDGMIRIPWPRPDKNGPYVVEVKQPGHEAQYLSTAGIRDEGPLLNKITEAAQFERRRDAKYFGHITSQYVDGNIGVVRESEALAYEQQRQSHEDMRTVLNLANEIEDRTPAEDEAIGRVTQSLDWASDHALNWSQDLGRGR